MIAWQPWSLRELVEQLRDGRTTPASALGRSRARIDETEAAVRAWVELDPTPDADPTGPLAGVPLGVKDIIDVAGHPTRCGSALRAGRAPAIGDAAIVAAWRGVGAVPMGKTVTTEFAYFAPGPTRNPAQLDHTPGGSSSGSAAAVAAGQVPLAIGTQTAGSVTRPAAYCGVASLVMSHGRFPLDGVVGLSPSLDSHGVFAATVSDLALAWSALSGDLDAGLAAPPAPRVALWTAQPFVLTDEMDEALARTRAVIESAGGLVEDFPLEQLVADVTAAHRVVMAAEAAQERAAELAAVDRLSEPLGELLRTGAAVSTEEYTTARRTITTARTQIAGVLARYDAIVGPAAPGAAPAGIGTTGDPVLSRAWQALGLPAVVVPGLHNPQGLPLGIQVIAGSGREVRALVTAHWIEQRLSRNG